MRFADVPGQHEAKRRLREMADSGRLPHALLLEGPEGSGKFALARAFAQYIHCSDRRPDGEPCGQCPSCRQHEAFNHIDTVFSFPVIKAGRKVVVSEDYIDEFRSFISESPMMDFELWREKLGDVKAQPQFYVDEGAELLRRLGFMTRRSQYRIVLLWLPERMNEETANKLLKLIEEPSGLSMFIMTSDNPRQILPTIYSRVQRVAVGRYSDAEISEMLISDGIDPTTAASSARMAEGNVNLGRRLAAHPEHRQAHFDFFVQLMRLAYARKVAELRQWSVDIAALGREPSMQFISYCCSLIRESFIMHLHVDELLALSPAEKAFLDKFHPFINEKNVEDLIALFDRARRDIAANANAKITFFDLAVRTIMLLRRK